MIPEVAIRTVFAFDVDHTLECSDGPIPMRVLEAIHNSHSGHIVGLNGNWACVIINVPGWEQYINFLGPMEMTKTAFLRQLKGYIPAARYVMVGNDGSDHTSLDSRAAGLAGWEFVKEDAFLDWWVVKQDEDWGY